MTWKKGKSGNPSGGRKDKWWADAIRKEGNRAAKEDGKILKGEDGKEIKRIELAAKRLFDRAENGEISAMKEIGDRLDGKPAQTIQGTDPEDGALIVKVIQFAGNPTSE